MAKKKTDLEAEAKSLAEQIGNFQFEDGRAYRVTFKHGTGTEVQGYVMNQGNPFLLEDIASIEPVDAVPLVSE